MLPWPHRAQTSRSAATAGRSGRRSGAGRARCCAGACGGCHSSSHGRRTPSASSACPRAVSARRHIRDTGRVAEHYFTASPSSTAVTHDVTVPARRPRPHTAGGGRGVLRFAASIPGTAVLLEHAPRAARRRAGCSISAAATARSRARSRCALRRPRWVAVDVNERARELTAANAASLGLAVTSRRADHAGPYDAIFSNPPIRIGKAALHDLLLQWLGRLAPEGVAYLVVQRNLGSDSLQRWLESAGASDRTADQRPWLSHPGHPMSADR